MQRSKPSPGWSAFFKKTPRYGTFRMYPSMLPSPRRGGCHLPARNNLLITYQVGRIRSVSNIMPFNGTLNQPSWWEDTILSYSGCGGGRRLFHSRKRADHRQRMKNRIGSIVGFCYFYRQNAYFLNAPLTMDWLRYIIFS